MHEAYACTPDVGNLNTIGTSCAQHIVPHGVACLAEVYQDRNNETMPSLQEVGRREEGLTPQPLQTEKGYEHEHELIERA